MLYTLLIYEKPTDFARRDPAGADTVIGAWRKYYQSMTEAGIYRGGSPLAEPDTGTTVRVREGKRQIQDGPYAGTKEQLGGFILVELPSLDAALEWASRCPAASYGAVEVRIAASQTHQSITGESLN